MTGGAIISSFARILCLGGTTAATWARTGIEELRRIVSTGRVFSTGSVKLTNHGGKCSPSLWNTAPPPPNQQPGE
ncbi:hypothetical protein M427DRAFT_61670 [Gonapodya prolifera JEL478]|uniref:Secreted protein n=1 Tax=Gonapodya prolifera (strain JEL478) TaxID=1344416 RepID=A0A139A1U9_GONPJ|nr:hypothetical protein M427DRAFT_61670 [Gonapodya prolifera JEL478]|eukprot:KXS10721.1 hypothetical protein M427DRAFT_61670 [Gonapodya prolifera JEL478]